MTHVAFKCNYNDGGEGEYVGFSKRCTPQNIKYNVSRNKRNRCNSDDPHCCKSYYNAGFSGEVRRNPCMESRLFSETVESYFGPGKTKKGQVIPINDAGVGDIAFITTRFRGDKEPDRKVIGFYKIINITQHPEKSIQLFADDRFKIRLPLEEANELFFWDYYSNKRGKQQFHWGSSLFRYLSENIAHQILADLMETLKDQKQKELIAELIETNFKWAVQK